MVRTDLFITVPSFFKCPISLDVMKSPVSLCTGVTYERSSIQTWLDNGNNTCPATMQVLHTKDLVPNYTLRRLIKIWSDSLENSSASDDSTVSASPCLSREQARDSVKHIENGVENCLHCLSNIIDFAKDSDENRKFLATIDGFVPVIVGVYRNVAVDFQVKIQLLEKAVSVLDLVIRDYGDDKEEMVRSAVKNQDFLASIVLVLEKGCLDSKIESAKVLETLAFDPESKILIAEQEGLLINLFRLINSESDSHAIDAGLSCLISVSIPRRVRLQIVRLGSIQILRKLLSHLDSTVPIIEKVLKLLEMISTSTEGRNAICEDPICVYAIVDKMLKISNTATDHAVVILWSVCNLFRDQRAQDAVTKSNGLTKMLLLMQSNCSPSIREMIGDLIKIFRVNSKSCLSSYETKTTHIMPF